MPDQAKIDFTPDIEFEEEQGAGPTGEPPRSLTGFAGNLFSSGGRFLAGTATGVVHLAKLAARLQTAAMTDPVEAHKIGQEFVGLVKRSPEIGRVVYAALKDRYGSGTAIAETLYRDPVGVLADIATVAGGVGLVAKAGGVNKVARVLSTVERATNPINIIAQPVAKAADLASDVVISTTVRPPAWLKDDFGGGRGIARAIKQERTASAAGAERKLQRSTTRADALLAEREAAGTRGVPATDVARAVEGAPLQSAQRREVLGVVGQHGTGGPAAEIRSRAARIVDANTIPGRSGTAPTVITTPAAPDAVDAALQAVNNLGAERARMIPPGVFGGNNPAAVRAVQELGPQANLVPRRLLGESQFPARQIEMGGTPSIPAQVREIPLTEAQALKREAQDLAFEAGKANLSLERQANTAIARALREGLEARVPEVAPINAQSQRLLGAKQALEIAEDRPNALGKMLALPTLGTSLLLDSPRLGASTGIAINEVGRALANPVAQRNALGARLIERALLEAMLQQETEPGQR